MKVPELTFKPLGNPILLISDAPEQATGLARIGRDLAGLLSQLPQFRVAYLGKGGVGRRAMPWMQYSFPESAQWGEEYLAEVWNDFSGGEAGVVMSLWDASRMLWFTSPPSYPPALRRFLGEGRQFEKWGYFPVDGTGPDEQSLPIGMQAATAGYDRVVAASEWGRGVLQLSGIGGADWLPHGIWMNMFKPNPEQEVADPQAVVVGCNMSNQARKDWPVAFETAALLKAEYGNKFKFWAHTDLLIRYWNFYALAADYGVEDCLEVTTNLTDKELAARYSACDVTMLPSASEGFGYPIVESLACGTACVVTGYGGGAELVNEDCRVSPVAWKVDTSHNVRRAVLSGWGFAGKCKQEIDKKRGDWQYRGSELRDTVLHLDWSRLRTVWEKWFLEGIS